MKRTLSVILAIMLAASSLLSLAACGDNSVNSDKPDETSTAVISSDTLEETIAPEETRQKHKLPDNLDFGGAVFNVVYPDWQGYMYYFFADESNGDAMNDAIYSRTAIVEEYLNVDLTQYCPGYIETILPQIKQTVNASDDAYQLALTHCISGVSDLVTGGYLYNFDNFKYTDYSAPWWNQAMMDVLRLGKNTYYGVSDYMIPCPYAIFFNKDIVKNYNLDNPYELVYNGEWTLDKFCEMAASATVDTNGDGKFTIEDQRGLCVEEGSKYISFMAGANQFVSAKGDDGRIALTINTDRTLAIVEKLANLSNTDGVIVFPDGSMSIVDGTLLFELHTIAHAVNYRDSEVDIGVLPYPKFDTAQENYISLDWGGLMCVPVSVQNPDMVGAVLELLAYESGNEVIPAYYDVLLEGKLARDTDTIKMLDILFDTIAYEVAGNYFGFTSAISDLFYTPCRLAVEQKSTDFASWYKQREKSSVKYLENFYKALDKKEGN